jgi:DNA-binding transcriptional ArsR family regulator
MTRERLQLCEDHRREAMPCARTDCRYHLADLYHPRGTPIAAMRATCALVVADSGPRTQEGVAELLGVHRSLVDQIEGRAAERLRASRELRDEQAPELHQGDRPREETTRDRILRILRGGPASREELIARGAAGSYQHVNETLNVLRREGLVTSRSRNAWELVCR